MINMLSGNVMRWVFLLSLFLSTPGYAQSSVWLISKGSHQLYIGGTIHVLKQSDYPLPEEFEQAYRASEQLVFETDISAVSSIEFQMRIMQAMTYDNGKTLRSELKADTYAALQQYCAAKGIPLEAMEQLRPQMIMLALLSVELQRLGMVDTGVDLHFYQRAIQDGKSVSYLESTSTQLDLLVNMGKGHEDQLILQTLQDLNSIDATMVDLKTAWRSGNQKMFEQLAITPMQKDFPDLYQDLLVTRNNIWLAHIEKMLSTTAIEFVLVGALHMIGQDGVLQQLQSRGYQVKQL